jgi:hypothetical protein
MARYKGSSKLTVAVCDLFRGYRRYALLSSTVGNFGGLITARTTSLAELVHSAGLMTRDRGGDGAWDLADRWQSASFPDGGDLEAAVTAIAETTGAPVIGAEFLDSDIGFVTAVNDPGVVWTGILDRRMAEDYGFPLDGHPIEAAVDHAVAWSAVAGLTPDAELIRIAFTDSRVMAEELYSVLLVGLGIPGARLPESE